MTAAPRRIVDPVRWRAWSRWARENLFSSVASTILTFVASAMLLALLAGMLGFIFGEGRQWGSVATNSRLYSVLAYPQEQFLRVWISLGVAVTLIVSSWVVFGGRGRVEVGKLVRAGRGIGGVLALVAVLAPWSGGAKLWSFGISAVLIVASGVGRAATAVAEGAQERTVSRTAIAAVLAAAVIGAMWILPEIIATIEIADTTQVPFTVIGFVGLAAYWLTVALVRVVPDRALRRTLVTTWLLSLPIIYLVVLRDPAFDYDLIVREDLPIGLAFGVTGVLLLWLVTAPGRREWAAVAGGLLLVAAIAVWFPPLNDIIPWIKARLLLLLLAMFTLAAPSLGGDRRARLSVVAVWLGTAGFSAYMLAVGQAGSTLDIETDMFGGLLLTLLLAFASVLLAFPLGIVLALGRTSKMPIFRMLSTGYIEAIRGVPLITILFFGALFLPLFLPGEIRIDRALRAIIAIALFSAAYLAETFRGGLQAIPNGQYEAARSLGMSTVQLTMLITLPQALRAVIPAIVGQIISLFKDTSLVFIIGLSEILTVASRLVPGQPDFIGSQRENLLFVALVYWMFTFTFSRASQRLERKLGIGER